MDRAEKKRLVDEPRKSLEADAADGDGRTEADEAARRSEMERACRALDEISGRTSLAGTSIRSLIEEGRRF